MSRTNTAAYESIKASQIVFQNPDRSFPEPGAVLCIDNLRGATAWTRNLDIDSVALAGPSSVGTLTYNNQLLVNGIPVGGGGGVGSGYNITVAGGAVNMNIQHDISMNRNSIQDCSSITIVAQYGTPGTFRSIGTDILLNKPFMVASSPYGRLILKGNTADQSSLTFDEGTKKLTLVSPQYEFKTSASGGNVIAIDASSQLYVDVSAGTYANVLGYDVATGAVRYQPAAGGGSDLSGGYNIAVGGGAINMNITQPVLMNDNPIVNASYVDISAGGSSGKIYYSNPSLVTTKHITISEVPDPYLRLQGSVRYGSLSYNDSLEETTMYGKNINIYSDNGSYASSGVGLTMSSQTDQRIWMNVANSGVIKSSLYLSNNNELIIGDLQIPTNPVLIFQGGKAVDPNPDTSAKIEYFDASGVEQLRLTSKNYAMNSVPAAGTSLPTVLGYDTSSGEIKAQPATNGISALSTFTYDVSGLLNVSGGIGLGTFIPPTTGIYGINFIIKITNDGSTPIVFNNTQDAFELLVSGGVPIPPPIKISSIQNRPVTSVQTGLYSTSIYMPLNTSTHYTIIAGNENRSGTCQWASCVAEVRIVKLC